MRFIPSATRSRCSDAKVAHGSDSSGKVRRQSRFGQNLPLGGVVAVKQHLLYVRLKIGYNWNISLNLLLNY
ncbi:hypothetical protein DW778_18810 [Odoribacter splanchnicus]|nr:hypothetical protein DW778_18810 [Odoribacter splanchnicus]